MVSAPSVEDLLVGPVPAGACCVVCAQIFRNPLLAIGCGHTLCQTCALQEIVERGRCPVDRSPLHREDLVPNRQLADILDGLKVRCRYGVKRDKEGVEGKWVHGGNCKEIFKLGDANTRVAHEEVCPYSSSVCPHPNCGQHMIRKDLPGHVTTCRYRAVVCPTCGGNVPMYRVESDAAHMMEQLKKENQDLKQQVLLLRRRLIRRVIRYNPADYVRLVFWILFKNHRFHDYQEAYGLEGEADLLSQVLTGSSFAVWLFLYIPSVWFVSTFLPSPAKTPADIRESFNSLSTLTVFLPLITMAAAGTGPLSRQAARNWGGALLLVSLAGFAAIGSQDGAIFAFAYAVAFFTTAMTAWATSSTLLQYVQIMLGTSREGHCRTHEKAA